MTKCDHVCVQLRLRKSDIRFRVPRMKLLFSFVFALIAACSNGPVVDETEFHEPHQSPALGGPAILPTGRVTDAANIIDEERESALSQQLARLEQATKHQMAIVTVNTLEGRDISDFTADLGSAWGVGREGYNDGVVVLVAPNERRVTISVADGLETALPDAACQLIIDQHMLPHFREGRLTEGIEDGVAALIERLILAS